MNRNFCARCKQGISVLLCFCMAFICEACNTKKPQIDFLKEGTNRFNFGEYNLTQKGFSQFEKELRKYTGLPTKLDVGSFTANISKNADVNSFTLNLYAFDENRNYLGEYAFDYDGSAGTLNYSSPKSTQAASSTPIIYNANSDITFLDSQLKRLPLVKQMEKLNFPRYVLHYSDNIKLDANGPIIDGSSGQAFSVLTLNNYKKGVGGKSDGHTAVIFTLYDGVSLVGKDNIYYRCKPADVSTLYGNRNFTMQCDYHINNNELSFTRDYGETWIPTDLTQNEVQGIFDFSGQISEGSYFIGQSPKFPIAFFYGYGKTVLLLVSKDNGKSWHDATPVTDFERDITRRFIGFTSPSEGCAALGTDWSMGIGEEKQCYFTHDGGKTWVTRDLPLEGTSHTLQGMAFSDKDNGVVTLESGSDDPFPIVYETQDGAKHWTELKLPWDQLPNAVDSFSKADSLTRKSGTFTLTFGQGSGGNKKVSFQSTNLADGWTFSKSWAVVKHTDG